jgi:thiol-disulfide isomerase/thioredoxin
MLKHVALYTALMFGANGAAADVATADALREGDMRKLVFAEPAALPEVAVHDAGDVAHSLSAWHGQWVVLNFWATWCAPCRHEMPSLDRLQVLMPDIAVLPVATGRNPVEGIERFYAEEGIANLPVLRDPKGHLARGMGVMGLPVTVILNPEGQEVARLIGDADWAGADALAVLGALVQP